jgi:cytochrome c553
MDPTDAFAKLVSQSPEEFEAAFHEYLRRLRPSGRMTPVGRRVQE